MPFFSFNSITSIDMKKIEVKSKISTTVSKNYY